MIDLFQFFIGMALSGLTAYLAYMARSLDLSGAIAAGILGTIVFGLGGWPWALLLLGFFISSTLLSRLFKQRKAQIEEKFSKGSRRDAWQVVANGGFAGLFVLIHLVFPGAVWPWLAFAGSLAAANADTWATELGVLNPKKPRLITTRQEVDPGTSGAVSQYGLGAAAAGSFFIALLTFFAWAGVTRLSFIESILTILIVTIAGIGGSLVDSWLGATYQAIYHCPTCRKETEKHPQHSCGTQTVLSRGLAWLNNDVVNTACTFSGGIAALILSLVL
ncbi:MAG: DUF92 domain-containing protein [Anaerolineaceae bacterium]|nr:DUF92 domain-containing protein [Anaerolineaceae bacterium]